MKNNSIKLIIVLFVCFCTQLVNAQKTIKPVNHCSNPDGWKRAHNSVMFFLTLSHMEEQRVETGTNNEAEDQIRPVTDQTICAALSQIVLNTPKYKSIDDNLDERNTKYFYRTDNFYYIFWDRKPEHDNKITGPKSLFIIVSEDFEDIWEYNF